MTLHKEFSSNLREEQCEGSFSSQAMVLRTKCKCKTYISSNDYCIKAELCPVLKITSELLVYSDQ